MTNKLWFLGIAGLVLAGFAGSAARSEEITTPAPAGENEHPLTPALKWAHEVLDFIDKDVKDYTCTFVKRERINGEVTPPESIYAKFRNKPFSTYMRFTGPKDKEGQEAIYFDGQNDGNLLGRGTGLKGIAGWVSLKPTGVIPMKDNHYPITESGIRNLTKRLIEVAENDMKYGECEVKFFKNAKINGESATCIQVVHPVPRRNFLYHMARIYVHDELKVPVRYEAYDWPKEPGGKPELSEEYTYLNMKINVGLTDADFNTNSYKR